MTEITTQDWPRGWTARERVETVALDRREFDAEVVAREAGVDVDTARAVLAELAEDYSDTRWADD
ncbi:hypothetical protein [Haloferax volcanii]|uniref:Uncharacterized protein n=2 Tax=Haloferax volcanii TaxID=2246 RepID=M0IAE5_HALVO|nr:hypothetical protein [Haloferax alexandrinus]ELZ92818.1 hypothetical protein C452_05090 [Haloferax alexandrinus JCM 10717]